MANNAMYTYRYVKKEDRTEVPHKFKVLDNMIREYFDSTRNVNKFPTEAIMASTFYMWSPGMPLMVYRNKMFKTDTSATELKKWASMGPFYKSYGQLIISRYPLYFLKYFIWPNAIKYYAPPIEFLGVYNSGSNSVSKETKYWFGYKSIKVYTRFKNNAIIVLKYYPFLSGVINVVMLCTLLCYLFLKGWKVSSTLHKGIFIGSTVWILNASFTILASSVALRFQAFPIIITTIISAFLLDWMLQIAKSSKNVSIDSEGNILEFKEILSI